MNTKQFQVTCVRAFDYLTAGDQYVVTKSRKNYYFRNVNRDSGTFIPAWLVEQAIKSGFLV